MVRQSILVLAVSMNLFAAAEAGPPPASIARAVKVPAPEVQLAPAKPKTPPTPPKPGPQPTRIGEHRTLTAAQLTKGAWLKAAQDEMPLWRLAVRSKGAAAMRIHFQEFRAPAGGKVWVHNGKEWFGPYTDRGMYGDGDFWSHVVPGDRLTIEYEQAGGAAPKAPPFKVQSVSHLTSNPFDGPAAR